jgi:hypothetical protein
MYYMKSFEGFFSLKRKDKKELKKKKEFLSP